MGMCIKKSKNIVTLIMELEIKLSYSKECVDKVFLADIP